jgi:hypothetical protein
MARVGQFKWWDAFVFGQTSLAGIDCGKPAMPHAHLPPPAHHRAKRLADRANQSIRTIDIAFANLGIV